MITRTYLHGIMGVRQGGVFSLSPTTAMSISAIFRLRVSFSSADIFAYARSMYLFVCSLNLLYAQLMWLSGRPTL